MKVKTHRRWGPWFGLRRGCWQPPHCVMHGSEGRAPAGASRITPAAPSIFHSRYFCSAACCAQREKKSNRDFFSNPERLLPCTETIVSLTSLNFTSGSRAPETSEKLHARSSAAPSSSYAAPWQRLGVRLHSRQSPYHLL